MGRFRPNALILGYPVITSGVYAHRESIRSLFAENAELAAGHSPERLVDASTPPTFIWHTAQDLSVPVENAFLFAEGLRQHDIKFELHIYQHGGHGLSLATKETGNAGAYKNVATWISMAGEWINCLDICPD
jgi:dipeptidyl aminopeptidase/acylaminoacyl peptidase